MFPNFFVWTVFLINVGNTTLVVTWRFLTFLEVLRQCQASEVQAANNAKPACEPRQTIEYLQDPAEVRKGSTMMPDQILVQRCSGSCLDNSLYQSCIASRKQARTIQVIFLLFFFLNHRAKIGPFLGGGATNDSQRSRWWAMSRIRNRGWFGMWMRL